ncbi:hypothetical protein SLEP1_g14559 [Rubroshorea leprosula]|uniref:Nuclease associated modular domain-containing protein n=1 Tax=Rubroshorea leprosula TaxID=152421 RepID=A0AAV5IJF8_9ROSI|nr:hypothetical protein SLEP1_g14559 [Rubroshorea leprosula]
MPNFHLRLSAPHSPANHVSDTLLCPLSILVEYLSNTPQANQYESVVKKTYLSFVFASSLRHKPLKALQSAVDAGGTSMYCKSHGSNNGANSFQKQNMSMEAPAAGCPGSHEFCDDGYYKEIQRRRKIGLANKGKVPWNKGKKHTAETCLRIKQRTIEALKDPKVRKRMAEHPHLHSDQSKAKISSSLRRHWAKRKKLKQLGENFFISWLESIAEAAKKGGSDQEEINWDSYEKIKQEIALQQLQRAAQKAKAKETAKLRAEKAKKAKAEKLARVARKRKEREEKAKAKRELKRKTCGKSKKDEGKMEGSQGFKLKQRLTKIRRKKSMNGQVTMQVDISSSHIPALEKLDIEFIRKEKMQREVPLAEQIRAARNRRTESTAMELLVASSASRLSNISIEE